MYNIWSLSIFPPRHQACGMIAWNRMPQMKVWHKCTRPGAHVRNSLRAVRQVSEPRMLCIQEA